MLQKIREYLTKVSRHMPSFTFSRDVDMATAFKRSVESKKCPACQQQTLQLDNFFRNPEGWEAKISCKNCEIQVTVNSLGFKFARLSSPGKAREK